MVRLRLDKVEIGGASPRQTTWQFARSTVRGTEYRYAVIDHNYRSRNEWEFAVRVPNSTREQIEIRPLTVPDDRAFAGLERRSLIFIRATRSGYTRFRYCQIALAVPDGGKTKDVVKQSERSRLPYWLRNLDRCIRQKSTVRPTRGTDEHALVILVPRDDHKMMIQLFLATKAWVMKTRFSL